MKKKKVVNGQKRYKVTLLRPFYVEAEVEANDVKEAYTKFEELLDDGKLELEECGDFYNQCPQIKVVTE